jgi:hypothetical protein
VEDGQTDIPHTFRTPVIARTFKCLS